MTEQALIQELLNELKLRTRPDGSTFYASTTDRIQDLAYHAHDGLLPDDWRYRMVHDCLEVLAENPESPQMIEIQIPINHSCLHNWLGGPGFRWAEVSEALRESNFESLESVLQYVYMTEQEEVNSLVIEWLDNYDPRNGGSHEGA